LNIAYQGGFGNYSLEFSELETLLENNTVFLKDNLLGSIHQISAGFVYNYISSSNDVFLSERFELVFQSNAVTSVNSNKSGISMNLFPNPSDSKNGTMIVLSGFETSQANLTVTDVLGKIVTSKTLSLQANGITEFQLKETLPVGVYTVKATGGKKTITQKWVVK
jgi:hypothetical protein